MSIATASASRSRPARPASRGTTTPTGVFVVLQKDKNHHSSTYNDAPMPNMNRLTWSGIALHAGNLPGYPASHGCVRLPIDFSAKLFSVTHLGTPVIIAGSHSDPWELTHPGMVLSGYAESEFAQVESGLQGKKAPSDWVEAETNPVVSVIASSAGRTIELVEDSEVIATSALTIKGEGPLGSHVFVLQGPDAGIQGMKWVAITHGADGAAPETNALGRLTAEAAGMGLPVDGELQRGIPCLQRARRKQHPRFVLRRGPAGRVALRRHEADELRNDRRHRPAVGGES